MADKEHLLDLVSERALLALLAGVAVYFLLSGVVGAVWAWRIVQAGFLFGIIYAGVSAVWKGIENHVHSAELRRRELRARDKEIERMDRENERLRTITLESMGNFLNVDVRTGKAEAHFRPASPHRLTIHNASGPDAAGIDGPRPQALPLLADADCGLVAGGRGAGKTELARWAMADKARAGWRIVVLDPKPHQSGKWPGCRVVGMDHDYAGIQTALNAVTANLRAGGHRLIVLIDELPLLNLNIRGFSDLWLPILLEGREYGVHCWLIAQSKTAGSIGLSGRYDLMECFDLLVLAKKDRAGNRWVEIEDDSGGEPMLADHPGPFRGGGTGAAGAGAGYPFQSGGPGPDDEAFDAEWTDTDTDGEREAGPRRGGGILAGLLAFAPRPKGSTDQTDAILRALHRSGRALAPAEVAEAAGLDKAYTRQALRRLLKSKQVAQPERGRYAINL